MLAIRMPGVEGSDDNKGQENPVLEFHMTPPFTSPSGPVQWRLLKAQPRMAIMPITVKVIANAKTKG